MDNYIKLTKDLQNSKQWQNLDIIHFFNNTYIIYQENFKHINNLLSITESEKIHKISGLRNRPEMKILFLEITRNLVNFLNYASLLIDHTRILYRKYYKKNFILNEYQNEINKIFNNDPLSNFIKRFRNYCSHYKIPEIYLNFHIEWDKELNKDNSKVIFCIKSNELLLYDDWNQYALIYLKNFEENINLHELLKEYQSKVTNFYNWFFGKLQIIHKEDYDYVKNQEKIIMKELGENVPNILNNECDRYELGYPLDEIFLSFIDPIDFRKIIDSCNNKKERIEKLIAFTEENYTILDMELKN